MSTGEVLIRSSRGHQENQLWPLLTGNKADYELKDFLWNYWVQLIVASPPKGAFSKWTKQVGQIDEFVVNLWSLKELRQPRRATFPHRYYGPWSQRFQLLWPRETAGDNNHLQSQLHYLRHI